MKKISMLLLVVSLVLSLALPAFADASFVLDFEKPELIGFKTICFNDGLADKIAIAPQDGFTGNAYKVSILEPEAGNTWWVTGLGISKDASSEADFKNLSTVTFKYKSTAAYENTPFIAQLVWKTKDKGEEYAKLQAKFPVEKGDVKEFKITVPAEVKKKLNAAKGIYLDWVMIGLEDKAGDDFRTGTFIIDDISFNKAAAAAPKTADTSTAPVENPKTGDSSMVLYSILALGSLGTAAGLKFGKKAK